MTLNRDELVDEILKVFREFIRKVDASRAKQDAVLDLYDLGDSLRSLISENTPQKEKTTMIISDSKHVLFIEPTQPASEEPIQDELTAKMRDAMSKATQSQYGYRGFHRCICGKTSDNKDYFLHTGQKTNSLAVHYLEYHRAEVPEAEIEKVRGL